MGSADAAIMTGAPPPYNAQSPTQQPRFAVYSPPNKSHPFYPSNEQQYQQHPPQTPPTFPQHSSLSRSPHYSHGSSPMPATLPPLNGSAPPPPHSDHSSQYQAHPPQGTPQFTLPRPFSGPGLSPNGAHIYNHSSPSHAHPPPQPGSHSQSPKKEQEPLFSMGGEPAGYPGHMMREPRPASPPKEAVCSLTVEICEPC